MKDRLPITDRLDQLREENEHLRESARTFGELAERLMRQLDAERRRRASRPEGRHQPGRQQLQQPVA